MARMKQQELTLEEKLKQALVPEDEQPYKVPENWVWTRIGEIANFIGGGTPSKSVAEYWNGDIPWASVKDIKGDYLTETIEKITNDGLINSASNICDIDDLILVTRIEPGKTIISKIQTAINQDLKIVKSKLPSKYLHYFFANNKQEFARLSSGSTVLGITLDKIALFKVPLPPLSEQQRIVDRIESLFAKLDQAKELAQNALDTFETRKAAILHKAFTGELTAKWREKNGVGMESWKKSYWSDFANMVKDKFDPTLGTFNLPYIGLEHIAKGNGIIAIGKAEDVKSLKTVFKSGDILYGRLRPYLNKHDIASFDGMCSTDILVFRTSNETTAKYLNYLMDTTPFINYAVSNSKGINLPRVSEKEIAEYIVDIPSLPEQQEIVQTLDNLFKKMTIQLAQPK